jgi:hypothetical protein
MSPRPSRMVRLGRQFGAVAVLACIMGVGSYAGAQAAGRITGRQIKDDSVAGRDIRDGSLRASDFALGTLRPGDFSGDPTGPAGDVGTKGPAGPVGPSGFRGVTYVVGDPVDLTFDGEAETVTASCPEGTRVIGGGTSVDFFLAVGTRTSAPSADGKSWVSVVYASNTIVNPRVYPWAMCAAVD